MKQEMEYTLKNEVFNVIYITGDTHGQFKRVKKFSEIAETTVEDVLIILGDAGINYHGNKKDYNLKKYIKKIPLTLFCVHGNHEMRPAHIESYEVIDYMGGKAYQDPQFPNIIFAIDGEIYTFNGLKTIVCGGAYSVDKDYRITAGLKWFYDEQPNEDIKQKVEQKLAEQQNKIDVFLSHTTPLNYMPAEMFLSCVDQSTVDKSTEIWLQNTEDNLAYKHWYCGHYHTDKIVDKVEILFKSIKEFKV